ncbi:MAG: hypothetical protein FWC15_06200 [Fibromonadales bacterium]|nr:hypothetical protein [Fibromonadales bacterium]
MSNFRLISFVIAAFIAVAFIFSCSSVDIPELPPLDSVGLDNSSSSMPSSSSVNGQNNTSSSSGGSSSPSGSGNSSSSIGGGNSSGDGGGSDTQCKYNSSPVFCQYSTACYAIDPEYSNPVGQSCTQLISNCQSDGGGLFIGVTNVNASNNYGAGVTCNGSFVGGTGCLHRGYRAYCKWDTGCYALDPNYEGRSCSLLLEDCYYGGALYSDINCSNRLSY